MYDYKNKKRNIQVLNDYMFARTLIMFEYEGLPETIPAKAFESQLQKQGFSFVTEVKGELYCFTGGLGGELNEYYEPTQIVVANPWLNFNETLDLEKDGVLCANDEQRQGLLPLLEKYHSLMVENDITMTLNSFNNRVQTLISAGDDATRESAEIYLEKVRAGEQGVIAEQRIFDGISVHNTQSNLSSTTMALTEFHQYLKASLYNELGLDANFNMKRERLTAGEVAQNDEGLYPLVTNMLYNRRKAVNEINEKYGTEITVTFGSVWKNRNLAGEMNQDMMLGHTEDMEAGQSDLELLAMLDAMLGEDTAEAPVMAQPTEEQPSPVELPVGAQPEAPVEQEGPVEQEEPVEEVIEGIQLSQEASEVDLDDLPDEERLEIYDLIFGIEDEEVDVNEVAKRIADILESHVEGAEDNESEEETAGETEPDEEQAEPETETEKAGPTEEEGRAEEEGTGEEEESREQEEEGSSGEDEVEEPVVEEPVEEAETEEPEEKPEAEEPETEDTTEPVEEEVAEIIAEAVEEVIDVIEEEEEEEGEED